MAEKEKFLKSNDAAHYLGVSRSSLTNWVKQGMLPTRVTPGGHYRFTLPELDAFAVKRGLKTGDSAPAADSDEKILIIDDDGDFREFVRDALTAFKGYELKEADDGMKGAMLVGSWSPDLVLLDIRMPYMNGVELLKSMRENPDTAATHVIIASAHLQDELKQSLEGLNADIILEKPVRLAKLIAAVQKLADLELED